MICNCFARDGMTVPADLKLGLFFWWEMLSAALPGAKEQI